MCGLLQRMDRLQAVRLFIRVVDLGSFSKAASEARIGQPAATKQIAQMEKQLGARLLHRTTHGVTPTEIGALYYEKCRLIAHHSGTVARLALAIASERLAARVYVGRLRAAGGGAADDALHGAKPLAAGGPEF